jgi:hypothetical protein
MYTYALGKNSKCLSKSLYPIKIADLIPIVNEAEVT